MLRAANLPTSCVHCFDIWDSQPSEILGLVEPAKGIGLSLHEDRHTVLIISRSVFRMKSFSDRKCRETGETHFVLNHVFPPKNCVVCEIMLKNIIDWGRAQMEHDAHAHCKLDT